MKNEKLIVPKLRFKEFFGEWEEKTIKNLGNIVGGGTPDTTNEHYWNGDIQWFTPTEIKSKYISNSKRTITGLGLKKSSAKLLPIGTLLLSTRATVGDVGIALEECTTNQGFQSLIVNKSNNNEFIYNWIINNKKEFLRKSSGSTFLEISKKEVEKIKINLPQKQEQEKIASFLSSIDKKINQLSKKDELLQNYKKAMMQKIFSQKLRFKKEDGSDYPKWEEFRLKEVLDYEQPTKYIVKSTEYCDSYDIPVLTAGKTFILGYTNEKQGIYSKSPVIIFDDFTTANHYVDFDFKIKSSAMKLLKEKNKNVNLKFVYEFIQRLHFPLGEHKRYWISEYSYLKIKLPSIEEQTKIANFLSSLDTKISQNKKALEKTQKFKKALLQKMFV